MAAIGARAGAAGEEAEHVAGDVAEQLAKGERLHNITRHMLGLLSGRPGAKALRQQLSGDTQQGRPVDEVFGRAMQVATGTL